MATEKPNYGFDAPSAIRNFSITGVFFLTLAYLLLSKFPTIYWLYLIVGLGVLIGFFSIYYAIAITLGGLFFKYRERDWLLQHLKLTGNETTLDLGCGHGLILIPVAKRLSTGKAYGIDIWAQTDQARNSREATLKNAEIEKVTDKIEVSSCDMRKTPFSNEMFDLITSSWAIHNIPTQAEREKALQEIVRVLKPGGSVAILDIQFTEDYALFFKQNHFSKVETLGPRYTFGNKTFLILATK